MKHVTETRTALAERSSVACPTTYELLGPVRVLRKELGLTSNDVTVLAALISFLPRDQNATGRDTQPKLTIVFPSNATLCERANSIDERTLRRCLGRLQAAGLIDRKTSANGKRFPLRYGGIIRDAFGIDLSPLIQSHDTLAAKASKLTEERERLRSLRAEALALRASLLQEEGLDEERLSSLGLVRNILRRATLTADVVLQIITTLRELGANPAQSYGESRNSRQPGDDTQTQRDDDSNIRDQSPKQMSARNGQNVRHTESLKKELKRKNRHHKESGVGQNTSEPSLRRDPATMAWEDFSHVASFFPDAPRTAEALNRILVDIGRLLRIRQDKLMRGLQRAGAGRLLLIMDYLLAKADVIRQPEAYFEAVLRA